MTGKNAIIKVLLALLPLFTVIVGGPLMLPFVLTAAQKTWADDVVNTPEKPVLITVTLASVTDSVAANDSYFYEVPQNNNSKLYKEVPLPNQLIDVVSNQTEEVFCKQTAWDKNTHRIWEHTMLWKSFGLVHSMKSIGYDETPSLKPGKYWVSGTFPTSIVFVNGVMKR